jgi:hypothetical protein
VKFEIAKPGRFTDTAGRTQELTAADLRACAAAYSKDLHEAPLVIGHPKANAPAYGWLQGLEFDEKAQRLVADAQQVSADFAETAKTHFKKRSTSFYTPTHSQNPTPGKWYVRHVGFLGAMPPGIKGLKELPADFAEGEGMVALEEEVEFSEWSDRMPPRLFRRIRDFFIEKFGQEDADRVLPAHEIDYLQEEVIRETVEDKDKAASFAEGEADAGNRVSPPAAPAAGEAQLPKKEGPTSSDSGATGTPTPEPEGSITPEEEQTTPQTPSAKELELAERERKLKEKEEALATKERAARHAEHVSFCESMVSSGRPLPIARDQLVAFMHRIDGDADDEFVSFGEGDERSSLQWFRDLLMKAEPTVDFSERAAGLGRDEIHDDEFEVASAAVKQRMSEAHERGEFLSAADAAIQLKEQR